MPKPKRFKKAANGQGSIFSREIERKDGTTYLRWEGHISLGKDGNGKRKRAIVYGASQAEVLAKLEQAKKQTTSGVSSNSLTLGEYLERWLQEKEATIKPSTHAQYERCVNLHINKALGGIKLGKVKPLDIQTLVRNINETSGNATANKCRTVLYSAFKQALRWQLVAFNPVDAVDPLPVIKPERRIWGPEEAARFLDTARSHRMYALFYLDMSTGLRRGELLGLRWRDIEGNVLHVRQAVVKVKNQLTISTPKTKKGKRPITLAPDVLEVLEQHRKAQLAEMAELNQSWTDLVFPSEVGTIYNPDNLKRLRFLLLDKTRKAWRKEAQEAGDAETVKRLDNGELFPHMRLQDLRHFHTSMLIYDGKDPKRVADRLGHSRASFTLDTYTHLFESSRLEAPPSLKDFLTTKREAN